ncbi:hypothetical protein BSL78_03003 [Apostichopus japonicus]|uniref:Fibrinogen C-terminal domain-containing protein n=1 Tax=Stichopus japonicus TaxID=307972 RepID=A0A2G8LIL3_STIJA|nr:hypothetical protein BSL78_03003 [Apostichopus japonicus]
MVELFSFLQVYMKSHGTVLKSSTASILLAINPYKWCLHHPTLYIQSTVLLYCDMDTDGGGWTVFQKRLDGSVGFYNGWSSYKYGFGNINSEYWLGNEKLFYLTAQSNYELRVDLSDFEGNERYARYDSFRLGDEATYYELLLGAYSGNAGK